MNVVAAVLILAGAVFAFAGALGLVRMKTFLERVHPTTMGGSLGVALTLVASMIHFSASESGIVLHEVLISVCVAISAPVGFILLVAAARQRRRQ
jgi:multicomponent K+:H+ antiporter subunit G